MIPLLLLLVAVSVLLLVVMQLRRTDVAAPAVDLSPITQQLARLEAGQAGQVEVGRRVEEAQRTALTSCVYRQRRA